MPKRLSCARIRGRHSSNFLSRAPLTNSTSLLRRCPTSRDFVPWRFSDAGRRSVGIVSACRHPKTSTTGDIRTERGSQNEVALPIGGPSVLAANSALEYAKCLRGPGIKHAGKPSFLAAPFAGRNRRFRHSRNHRLDQTLVPRSNQGDSRFAQVRLLHSLKSSRLSQMTEPSSSRIIGLTSE